MAWTLVTTPHDVNPRGFASDNYSGAHPDVLAAIVDANGGHAVAYGDDACTARLQEVIAGHLGEGVEAFPVFDGTGANATALASMLPRWGAVVTASTAHIHVDEQGAPERIGGMKLLPVPTRDGKLTTELIDREAWGWGDEHRAQPLVVSLTQSTELVTLYTPDELRAICVHAHGLGTHVYVDGARIANAAASPGLPLRAFTRDVGVDVMSIGGTKNGALGAEAIVALNPDAATGLRYLRKMNLQLASKMRFVSAQLVALFAGDLWLRNAAHSNAMAARLRAGVEVGLADGSIRGVDVTQPPQANAVFATLAEGVAGRLRRVCPFSDWDAARNEVRWMCSVATTEDDVDAFVPAITRETTGA